MNDKYVHSYCCQFYLSPCESLTSCRKYTNRVSLGGEVSYFIKCKHKKIDGKCYNEFLEKVVPLEAYAVINVSLNSASQNTVTFYKELFYKLILRTSFLFYFNTSKILCTHSIYTKYD